MRVASRLCLRLVTGHPQKLDSLWLKLTNHNKTHSLSRDYF